MFRRLGRTSLESVIGIKSKTEKRFSPQQPLQQRGLVCQAVSNRVRCDQSARVGEIATIAYRMEATARCCIHKGWIAVHGRGSVIDVMNRPTFVSPSWPSAASSEKSHDGWAIISRIGLPYAYSEQVISYIYRIPMPLICVPSYASWPKQFSDLRPLEEGFRLFTDRKSVG